MKPWLAKFHDDASKPKPQSLPPRGDRAVRKGSRNDAEAWRGAFLAAIRIPAEPVTVHEHLMSGIHNRAWTLLARKDGARFRTFEQFCNEAPPFGLGVEPDDARACLGRLLGKREATLALAPPSNMGIRPLDQQTSHPGGERSSGHEQRLRAVAERAPAPVRRLCELGLLTYGQAAQFGPAKPSAKKVAEVDNFTAAASDVLTRLGDTPQESALAEARQSIRALLPATAPTPSTALRLYARLTGAGKEEFLAGLARELEREGRQLVVTAVATAAE